MIAVSVVLAVVCGILLVLLFRRSRTADLSAEFQRWRDELKGRYDQMLAEQQSRAEGVTRERDDYRELTAKWKERIDAIGASLQTIYEQAVKSVSSMADTLKPIVSIFRSPQAAGIEFGETELEVLLRTHLGESLYQRKPTHLAVGQEVVDFAITLPDCVVPIDSKFPSAGYRGWVEAASEPDARAAWRKFRDEMLTQMEATAKYIKPDAGTTDYALLFVPSDIIYQQAFLTQRLYDQDNPIPRRSQELQVFGCSTQTLMPYLGLIRLGLRNLKISEDVKGIRRQIEQLDVLFKTFSGDWEVLRGHVDRLEKHVERVAGGRGSLGRLGEAVRRLAGPDRGPEVEGSVPPAAEPLEGHELFQTDRFPA